MAQPVTRRGWPAPEPDPGLPDDALPESPARAAPTPQIAASVALSRALAARGIDAATLQGVVVIGVPGPDWVEPVCEAWPEVTGGPGHWRPEGEADALLAGPGHWMVLTGDPPLSRHQHERILARLAQGRSILAVSQAPERSLPPDLLRAADLRLQLLPLDPEDLGEVAAAITGGPPTALPPAELCALISPRSLGLARRLGQSADDLLRRAARIAAGGLPRHPARLPRSTTCPACRKRSPGDAISRGIWRPTRPGRCPGATSIAAACWRGRPAPARPALPGRSPRPAACR
jgi:hypothetical protein